MCLFFFILLWNPSCHTISETQLALSPQNSFIPPNLSHKMVIKWVWRVKQPKTPQMSHICNLTKMECSRQTCVITCWRRKKGLSVEVLLKVFVFLVARAGEWGREWYQFMEIVVTPSDMCQHSHRTDSERANSPQPPHSATCSEKTTEDKCQNTLLSIWCMIKGRPPDPPTPPRGYLLYKVKN